VIVPETIVCDHGKAYISRTFQNAGRAMGISFQPTHKGSPWEEGNVERSFDSVDTLFAHLQRRLAAGFDGGSTRPDQPGDASISNEHQALRPRA
jgi:putative transposase